RLLETAQLVAHQRQQVQRLDVLGRVGQRAQDLGLCLAESLRRHELAGRGEMGHRWLHARGAIIAEIQRATLKGRYCVPSLAAVRYCSYRRITMPTYARVVS